MKPFRLSRVHIRLLSVLISIFAVLLAHFTKTPNPMMILIIPVVSFAYLDGYISGALSGIVALLYSLYFFSNDDKLFTYNNMNMQKVMTIVAAVLVIVILVGKLKGRDVKIMQEKEELLMEFECMNEDLDYAIREAKKANVEKSRFLSRMSHDIRTPMNVILGMTEFAIEEIDNKEKVLDYLQKIDSSGKFLIALINDVLDMSKIESGELVLNSDEYDVKELINDIKAMFEPMCKAKNVTLRIETDLLSGKRVEVDSVRLKQVFFNIVGNAVKFTLENGTVAFFLNAQAEKEGEISYTFIIEDNGIGMSKAFQEQMYEPFSQEKNYFTDKVKGSGLGLPIVKNIVDAMGGTIEVDSQEGKGTKFTLTFMLPVSEKGLTADEEAEDVDLDTLKGRNVLLVEDQPLNVEIAVHILNRKDIIVTCAEDGRQAVEVFEHSPIGFFDAILMDIQMPVMDGFEATERIRKLIRKDAGTVPIIAMTANAFDDDVRKSLEKGMNEHLIKPINPVELYRTLALQMINQEVFSQLICETGK